MQSTRSLIDSFKTKKVLLVGDAILDVYMHGTESGIALGTSVPRVQESHTVVSFGGNGLIAANILELGGTVYFVSVVGDDDAARHYDSFASPNLKKFFFVDPNRKTTVKRRIFANGNRLLHFNSADNHAIPAHLERSILKKINTIITKVDSVVAMDPQHGLLTKRVIDGIRSLSHKHGKPFFVDAQISHKKSNHALYKGVDTMFLNEPEARAVHSKLNLKDLPASLDAIRKRFKFNNVIIKLGERGSAALFGSTFVKSPGFPVKAVDPVGAGDAFLAAFSLGDTNRLEDSLFVANVWAGLSTTIPGTTPPKLKQLYTAVKR